MRARVGALQRREGRDMLLPRGHDGSIECTVTVIPARLLFGPTSGNLDQRGRWRSHQVRLEMTVDIRGVEEAHQLIVRVLPFGLFG
jgi:hypothetical protein